MSGQAPATPRPSSPSSRSRFIRSSGSRASPTTRGRSSGEAGYERVSVHLGDGTLGLPDHAPYDAIAVAAVAPTVPAALWNQLRDGGSLALPLRSGRGGRQSLCVFRRERPGGRRPEPRRRRSGPVCAMDLVGTATERPKVPLPASNARWQQCSTTVPCRRSGSPPTGSSSRSSASSAPAATSSTWWPPSTLHLLGDLRKRARRLTTSAAGDLRVPRRGELELLVEPALDVPRPARQLRASRRTVLRRLGRRLPRQHRPPRRCSSRARLRRSTAAGHCGHRRHPAQFPREQALVVSPLKVLVVALLAAGVLAPLALAGDDEAEHRSAAHASPRSGSTVPATTTTGESSSAPSRMNADQVEKIFLAWPKVKSWLERYPKSPGAGSTRATGTCTRTVNVFSGLAGEVASGTVDDVTGAVLTAYTGPQVAWEMARGGPGAFGGREINSYTARGTFCLLAFLIGLVDWRRLLLAAHRRPAGAASRSRPRSGSSTAAISSRRRCSSTRGPRGCSGRSRLHRQDRPRPARLAGLAGVGARRCDRLSRRLSHRPGDPERRERDRRRPLRRDRRGADRRTVPTCYGDFLIEGQPPLLRAGRRERRRFATASRRTAGVRRRTRRATPTGPVSYEAYLAGVLAVRLERPVDPELGHEGRTRRRRSSGTRSASLGSWLVGLRFGVGKDD